MALHVDNNKLLDLYERTEEHISYANGFEAKQLKTRIGKLDLAVPQT